MYPTQTLHAGEVLPLTLYWQAGTTTSNLYTVFVHLETLNGHVIAQIDAQPQGGGMPTTSWATGQVIPDAYPVTDSGRHAAGRVSHCGRHVRSAGRHPPDRHAHG